MRKPLFLSRDLLKRFTIRDGVLTHTLRFPNEFTARDPLRVAVGWNQKWAGKPVSIRTGGRVRIRVTSRRSDDSIWSRYRDVSARRIVAALLERGALLCAPP